MSLNLLQLGSVSAFADTDALRFTAPADFDLSSRAGWPIDAISLPQGMQLALEVEQCLEMGLAISSDSGVAIPNESFPSIRRKGLRLIDFATEWSPLLLKIERLSDIGRSEFKYRYSFLHESRPIKFDRTGYFGTLPGSSTIYRLDDQTFALVSEMDRFNALAPSEKTRSESWLAFSKVKECAIDVGARLDGYLLSNDVIVPQHLDLDVHTWPDGSVSFAPHVRGLDGPGLKNAFINNRKAQDFYSVDGPNNSRLRVVFDQRQTEALERMKDVGRVHGETKDKYLNDPESVFEGLLDVLEVRYGRRVTGIGSIQAPSQTTIPRDRSVLDTGVSEPGGQPSFQTTEVTTADGTKSCVQLESSSQQQDFTAAAAHAFDQQSSTFSFGGREILLDESVREYLAKKDATAAEPIEDNKGVPSDAYLIPYQDDEELKSWDIADADEARRPSDSGRGCIIPPTLRPEVVLMPHQLDGLAWLQNCHRLRPSRRGSLLADDMGPR